MWIKKLFKREDKANDPEEPMEEEQEYKQSKIFTVSQQEVDLRYSQLRILKTKSLNLPHNELHFTESVFLAQKDLLQARSKFSEEWRQVQVVISDRQMLIMPNILTVSERPSEGRDILHVLLGMVERVQWVENKKEAVKLQFVLKDNRSFQLQSVMGDVLKEIEKLVREFAFPNGINKFYAFKYGKIARKETGWKIYDFQREMERQGVWRYTVYPHQPRPHPPAYQLVDNHDFQLSPTYPPYFIVPAKLTVSQIGKCAKFRTKERLPMLTFFYQYKPNGYASLFRCSQTKGGLLTTRSPEDEKMITAISQAAHLVSGEKDTSQVNCKIFDARGYYAAWGNKIAGKGFESEQNYHCELTFLNIPNIHAVRDSYNRIKNYDPHNQEFIEVIGESGWLDYLGLILKGAKEMAANLQGGKNVIVHCSDGWDRTTQLACLAQLLLDPYFRTIEGFIVLVEKDWREGGHKFRERSGQYNHKDYHPKENSPVFLQFLDCVLQIMVQFPLSFQLNQAFLLFLAKAYQSCTYGTFLTNNLKQASAISLHLETVAVWADLLEHRQQYSNPFYRTDGPSFLDISTDSQDFIVWKQMLIDQNSYQQEMLTILGRQKQLNSNLKQQMAKLQQEISHLRSHLHDP